MHLVYLGQTGLPGTGAADSSQSHEVVVGLMLHETQITSINGEFDALCRRYFGSPLGEDEAPGMIDPVDLFDGMNQYSSWDPERRSEMIQDCLNVLIRRETPVLSAFINKQTLDEARSSASSPAALLWNEPIGPVMSRFLFALSMYLDEMNMANLNHDQIMSGAFPVTQFAMVVAQEGANIAPRFMAEFLRSDEGLDATALHENLCFVNAEDSPGMQLANLCAYFTRRWLQTPTNPNPYFETLRDNKVIQVLYPVAL
jgi:hypothetical protein